MGTSTYENLPTPIGIPNFVNQRPDVTAQPLPNFTQQQSTIPKSYQTHTTLPRQTAAFTISATLPNSSVTTHRTIPRTLTTRAGAKLQDIINDCTQKEFLRPTITTDITTPTLLHPTQQDATIKLESSRENTNLDTFREDIQIQPSSASSSGLQQIERQPLAHKIELKSHDFKV